MPATKSLIQKFTLSTNTSSITFSSIPSTYTDLVILVSARSSWDSGARDIMRVRFNGGGDTNHSSRYLWGDGATATSSTYSYLSAGYCPAATATANTFGNSEIYIPNYSSTTANKSVSVTAVDETNETNAAIIANAGLWASTAAITSVTVLPSNGSFVSGSTFYLYGIQASPNTPILTQGTQTLTSTQVTISNYNAALTYTVTASAGTASRTEDTITVSGLSAGQTVTVTVTTADSNGYTSATASGSFSTSPVATGGAIVESGGYRYHTFSSSGSFVLNTSKTIESIVIAGGAGGGGGFYAQNRAGGGGAGGLLYTNSPNQAAGTYPVTIGGGGGSGGNGTGSSISTIATATGGGRGGGLDGSGNRYEASPGGSGGGRWWAQGAGNGSTGSGVSGQGFPGGGDSGSGAGGGGGSAGNNPTTAAGGNGTDAYSVWASATSTGVSGRYAAGGGGTGSGGGAGGGGTGGAGGNATPGTGFGSGGGGAKEGNFGATSGGSGSSGGVIIRYAI